MSETPSWLKEPDTDTESLVKSAANNSAVQSTAKAVAKDPAVQKATVNAVKAHVAPKPTPNEVEEEAPPELDIDPDEVERMEKFHRILRVGFMAISILMATAACLKLESTGIATVFIALYVFVFSILICCFELSLSPISRWIAMNFGFLYSFTGRILFLSFVAIMCYSLGIFGKVVMALLFVGLAFNVYVLIVCPQFEGWLRHKHFWALRGGQKASSSRV